MIAVFECRLADAAATERAGTLVSDWMRSQKTGCVIFLQGDLGAGKTTLVRGVLRALGVTGPIRSPSYTLIEPYDVHGRMVLHLDLYRMHVPDELETLGLRDYPTAQTCWLVEWPERGAGYLPHATLCLELRADAGGRRLRAVMPEPAADSDALFEALTAAFGPGVQD
jgi:tRNA threonylcarbamoyladenosine biosynthesis protein TsaE